MPSLKTAFRDYIRSNACKPGFYAFYQRTLFRWSHYFQVQRAFALENVIHGSLDRLSPGKKVLRGPFAGMAYPSYAAVGSSLSPKIIGSYEHELHAQLNALRSRTFPLIVNVGCAEGYYAVGLARCFPTSEVLAYDLSPYARPLCAAMAELNGVGHRVKVQGYCDPAHLARLATENTCLIVCDCEGFEEWMFTPQNKHQFATSTLIIETHDFASPAITQRLRELFANSHDCVQIPVAPPADRKALFKDLLSPVATEEWVMDLLLDEARPSTQFWVIFTPKNATPSVI